MLKLVISGIWVVIVALIAVYFSVQMAMAPKVDEAAAARKAAEETIRGELTSLPVIDGGAVKGYFLTRLSYVVDKVKMAGINVPIDVMITDELYTTLVGDRMIDLEDRSSFDVAAFRNLIKEAVNKRLGEEVVFDVLIEQIDYLSKEDLRASMAQKKGTIETGESIVKGDVPKDGAPAEGGAAKAH
jgi:hypothetical protein